MSDYSTLDLAWAAGFLDGEGCFVPTYERLRSGGEQWGINISAGQTRVAPILRLKRLFGGEYNPNNSKNALYWRITSSAAAKDFLPLIIPYLTVKQTDAYRLLEYAHTFSGKRRITPEIRAKRYEIWQTRKTNEPPSSPDVLEREEALAWAGGFLDAEGCFTLSKIATNNNPANRSLLVSGSQKYHPVPLIRLKEVFQTGSVQGPNCIDAYGWYVRKAPDVIRVIDEIEPYITIKTREARIVRAFAQEMGYRGKRALPDDVIERRMALISELAEIRGV